MLVGGVAAVALAYPPQTREIYRALAEDPSGNVWRFPLTLLLLCGSSMAFAAMTRELLREPFVPTSPRVIRTALPLLCAGLIPAGLAFGLYFAAFQIEIGKVPAEKLAVMPELNGIISALSTSRVSLLVGATICAVLTASIVFPRRGFRSYRLRRYVARARLRTSTLIWVSLCWLVFFSIFSVKGSQFIGAIGIFLLGLTGIGAMASFLTRAGDRRQLPLLSLVVAGAILLAALDLTDNHSVTLTNTHVDNLPRAQDLFEAWYKKRGDRDFYEKRGIPYPVFIVAAAGGGLYAAHHAATALSRIQDRCPNFAQHIFAISAVSGGSMGSALFASLAKSRITEQPTQPCPKSSAAPSEGPFERQINYFLENDFLSPLLAATLFPDAVQRFIPAFTTRFDRARALDDTLAQAWTKLGEAGNPNAFSQPFLEHWNAEGAAPALILNTTNVEHGYRMAITPFRIVDMQELGNIVPLSNLAEFHQLAALKDGKTGATQMRDISLATAVSLSARFPWILPAGRVDLRGQAARLVDGGYVDNLGAETVFDLMKSLEAYYTTEKNGKLRDIPLVRIHFIILTSIELLQKSGSYWLGDTLSPIRTMLSARETRAMVAMVRLWRLEELCEGYAECGHRISGAPFPLNLYDFDLPLGWLLAPSTRKIVELHSGVAARAGTYLGNNMDDQNRFERLGAYVEISDGAACQVEALLRGEEDRRCRVN